MLDSDIVHDYAQNYRVLDTEPSSGRIFMLSIQIRAVRRATLPARSGNEGWIGVSPMGDRYHVVVPVDAQIAKGVLACNRPTDGTPFGGYTGWLYFRCEPYDDEGADESASQESRVHANCTRLIEFAALYGITCEIETEQGADSPDKHVLSERAGGRGSAQEPENTLSEAPVPLASCGVCGNQWHTLAELLRDPNVRFARYRVCPDDFSKGAYVFTHTCSGAIEVPVTRFGRTRVTAKSLIGTQACPGMCRYETSQRACQATCEGASYRRIAARLQSRSTSG